MAATTINMRKHLEVHKQTRNWLAVHAHNRKAGAEKTVKQYTRKQKHKKDWQ